MADCCTELREELAALRNEIANLQRINEDRIVKRAEASIIPQIPGIINPIIITNLNPFKLRLGRVESASSQALDAARQSLERAYTASDAARSATNTASSAASKAGQALSKVAGIAASLAALAASVATLLVLGNRLDSQERRLDVIETDLSKYLGLLNPIKSQAEKANTAADKALASANCNELQT